MYLFTCSCVFLAIFGLSTAFLPLIPIIGALGGAGVGLINGGAPILGGLGHGLAGAPILGGLGNGLGGAPILGGLGGGLGGAPILGGFGGGLGGAPPVGGLGGEYIIHELEHIEHDLHTLNQIQEAMRNCTK